MNTEWDPQVARLEIMQRLHEYCWGYDSNDMQLMGSVFTEQATSGGFVTNSSVSWGPWIGKSSIVDALSTIRNSQPDRRRHVIDTYIFDELTESTATARAYVTIFSYGNGREPHLVSNGEYSLGATKTSTGWRFNRVDEVLDCPF